MVVVSVLIVASGVGLVVQAVVVGEVVGAHVQGAKPRVVGQVEWQRRRLFGLLAVLVDEVAHAGQMRSIGL